MVCASDQVRKAAVFALFAAIRAAMRGLEEERMLLERLAIRLDLLSSLGAPVAHDPEVEEILTRLSKLSCDGFGWVVDEICTLLVCMGVECGKRIGEGG